ncbi:MAG: hypothetical protein ACI9JN_002564, partial [Bacteroidia bacterium]
MTSVQNHLPLLSGNKILAILSAVVLLSCNAFKVVSNDKPVVVEEKTESPTKSDTTNPEETATKTGTKPKLITVDFFGKEIQVEPHKTEFKIALILPFHYEATTASEKRMSDYMLEYYQGVKLAMTNLELYGFRMKLYVYDDENSTDKLKSILGKSNLKSVDVIIGSVGKQQMQMVSTYGLDHDIPVISPITSLDTMDEANPTLYCTTPSNLEKVERVMDFIEANYSKKSVIIITDEHASSQDMKLSYLDGFKMRKRKAVAYETPEYNGWGNILSKDEPTVIILQSRNPTTVSTTLSKIYQTKRDVIIIGDNSWSNFQDNDYKFWNKMHVHLVASDYVNDTSAEVKNFKLNFRLINRTDPGVYAYIGYDQFMFMGEFLM